MISLNGGTIMTTTVNGVRQIITNGVVYSGLEKAHSFELKAYDKNGNELRAFTLQEPLKISIEADLISTLQTTSGDIIASALHSIEVVKSTSGDIRIDGSARIVNTVSGDVVAHGVIGPCNTVSGNISKY